MRPPSPRPAGDVEHPPAADVAEQVEHGRPLVERIQGVTVIVGGGGGGEGCDAKRKWQRGAATRTVGAGPSVYWAASRPVCATRAFGPAQG
jgi:hypothetical protein